jgi:hypothetical protein
MAAYNPRNFDLGQFMNDLFLQPDLSAQFQFLGNCYRPTLIFPYFSLFFLTF